MGRRFVRQPDGMLAAFSEISDSFTHSGLTVNEAVEVAITEWECNKWEATNKVDSAAHDRPRKPLANPDPKRHTRWQEAIDIIAWRHGTDILKDTLIEMGLDPDAPENQPFPGVTYWRDDEP